MQLSKLTVYFEEPFWVGVFERVSGGRLSACKVTFGAEPKDYEVWEFVLKHYDALTFSPGVAADIKPMSGNPKRRQREAQRQALKPVISTKSQEALRLQREASKVERKRVTKAQKEAEAQRQFDLKRQKRKDRHKGH